MKRQVERAFEAALKIVGDKSDIIVSELHAAYEAAVQAQAALSAGLEEAKALRFQAMELNEKANKKQADVTREFIARTAEWNSVILALKRQVEDGELHPSDEESTPPKGLRAVQ